MVAVRCTGTPFEQGTYSLAGYSLIPLVHSPIFAAVHVRALTRDQAPGWIAGSGAAGSAIIPFMTGALASRFGIGARQILVCSTPSNSSTLIGLTCRIVVMMALMASLWALVLSIGKRDDGELVAIYGLQDS